jgi:two-component system chemotaxis response regulator CheB
MKTKWIWLGQSKQEIVEIALPQDGFAIALIAKKADATDPVRSRICVLSKTDLQNAQGKTALNWLREGMLAAGMADSEISEVRLIGTDKAIGLVKVIFQSDKRFSIGKPVMVTEPFPLMQFLPKEGRIRLQRKDLSEGVTPLVARSASPLKVLIVDDSETIRNLLTRIIAQDPALECVAAVGLPSQVEAAIQKFKPDVLTLDIHMPEMNGVELLKKLMKTHRIPTVMISSLSMEEGTFVLDALEAGAVDYIQKPSMKEMATAAPLICEKIRNAGGAKIQTESRRASGSPHSFLVQNANIDMSCLILIGSSTGGTEALKEVLTSLPESIPPILIVQHIPAVFSKAFADRMNSLCRFEVKEAEDGDIVQASRVLIAPGGKQMLVRERRGELVVAIEDGEPVNRHRPSVDVLFHSVAVLKPRRVAAGILTGMGSDGAKGMLALRQAGARTLAQDEATCVVFGMPKEAIKIDAAERIVPLQEVAKVLLGFCEKGAKKRSNAEGVKTGAAS